MTKDQLNAEYSAIWDKYGAFFAFSDNQYKEKATEGVKYVNMVAGLIAPKDNANAIMKEMGEATDRYHAYQKERNKDAKKRKELIMYTLNNYECFHSMDITDAVEELEPMGITREEIQRVFNPYTRNK